MGYIYEAMGRAKKAIAASFSNIEEKYKDVFALIDARWNVQLHRPLHAAGYYLNLEFYYANSNVEQDEEVKQGLYACIRRVVPTIELQDKILDELPKYKKVEGLFGIPFAIRHRTTKAPALAPNLQTFAIKILSLTCSSSGCERNRSIFEHLHSKKRNKLEQKRLNDLVFIKYNRALRRRYDARDTIDPIRLDEINESNEWLLGRSTLDSGEENAIVFEDDELTWGDIVRAVGVDEDAYSLQSQSTIEPSGKSKASSSKASKKASSFKSSGCRLNLIDEEEEDEKKNFDDSNEVEAEYRSDENGDDGNESEEFEDYLVESDDWI
ncbi:uncharacterized protein LOC105162262 [Sesamum indicum]|uniref:Uncharacterized protein LOC105162262 n=1 Tax=Sesamum indicum TaxID=4182 RepID=A0A8M8UT96_SESIN|nr:uncharacterized protein LOC105162262 [Sesamum indicum]